MNKIIHRHIEKNILEATRNFRVTYIDGARQTGKTTLIKQIGLKHNLRYLTFDNENLRALAKNSPDLFFELNSPPLIIDEVQKVPEILEQIKIHVDNNTEAGQFILTGSVDILKSQKIKETLAGRLVQYELYPFSFTEIKNFDFNIIDLLFCRDLKKINANGNNEKVIISRILTGLFPEIYQKTPELAKKWFKSYINARIKKDIYDLTDKNLRKINILPELIKVLANQTSNLLNYDNIANKLNISPNTAKHYISLLESLFLVKKLKPYSKNIAKTVKKTPKIYFIDTGLVSYLLKITEDKLLRDRQLFGKLLENYIFLELQKHISISNNEYELYYFRDNKKQEIDFIIENNESKTIAIEVKSASRITDDDLKGIKSFLSKNDDKLSAMYVIYGGKEISAVSVHNKPVILLPYASFF